MAMPKRSQSMMRASPTPDEAQMARTAQRCMLEFLDHSRMATITIQTEAGASPAIEVPAQALRLIADLMGAFAERRDVVLLAGKRECTTVEAASFLNVSRPFVIKEIEAGRLKHRMVGTHRRIEFEDLQAYAREMRARQSAALQRMADDANDLGLDY